MCSAVVVEPVGLGAGEQPGTVVLDDGRRVTVRPIHPDDTEPLRAMHRRLSPDTVQRRFFTSLPELPVELAEHFTHVDGRDRAALVAVDPANRLVGVARYDREPGTSDAEVAVVIQDDYQHQGLGTAMLRRLRAHGRSSGIARFTADVLTTNRAMFGAFAGAGLTGPSSWDCGIVHMELSV